MSITRKDLYLYSVVHGFFISSSFFDDFKLFELYLFQQATRISSIIYKSHLILFLLFYLLLACENRNYFCTSGNRNNVQAGYYATGCTTDGTRCSGQTQCADRNSYCTSGTKYTVSVGYYSVSSVGQNDLTTSQSPCEVKLIKWIFQKLSFMNYI